VFARVPAQLAGLACWLVGLSLVLASPREVLAVTAIALIGVAVAVLASAVGDVIASRLLPGRAAALREKAWSAAFQRQRDPDAAGRPRPRAPSAAPAAA
jgi:hypothetical protein